MNILIHEYIQMTPNQENYLLLFMSAIIVLFWIVVFVINPKLIDDKIYENDDIDPFLVLIILSD